jgi:hypothetical protein
LATFFQSRHDSLGKCFLLPAIRSFGSLCRDRPCIGSLDQQHCNVLRNATQTIANSSSHVTASISVQPRDTAAAHCCLRTLVTPGDTAAAVMEGCQPDVNTLNWLYAAFVTPLQLRRYALHHTHGLPTCVAFQSARSPTVHNAPLSALSSRATRFATRAAEDQPKKGQQVTTSLHADPFTMKDSTLGNCSSNALQGR